MRSTCGPVEFMLPADGVVAGSRDGRGSPVTTDGPVLFCGMSIGYEDPTVSYARRSRAPLKEIVTFVGA